MVGTRSWLAGSAYGMDNNTGMNQQSHVILPLPDWKDRDGATNILAADFTGWLVGFPTKRSGRVHSSSLCLSLPRAGILAESMGLGKLLK
jgi:hypothetical protein